MFGCRSCSNKDELDENHHGDDLDVKHSDPEEFIKILPQGRSPVMMLRHTRSNHNRSSQRSRSSRPLYSIPEEAASDIEE